MFHHFTLTPLLLFISLHAQAPDTLWTRTYGSSTDDFLGSGLPTFDGGYAFTGEIVGGGGHWINYLLKIDMNGDTVWLRTYPDFAGGADLLQTPDSGFVILAGDSGPSYVLIRTNKTGDTVWTKQYYIGDFNYKHSVLATSDGGYIIAGTTVCLMNDVWCVRTDSLGDTLWTVTFGGAGRDVGCSIQPADGGYFVVGYTNSYGAGGYDVLLLKIDENGDTLWAKTYGGTLNDMSYDICRINNNEYIISGSTASYAIGGYDMWILSIDTLGDVRWAKTYGSTMDECAYSIVNIEDSGSIIVGYTASFGHGAMDIWVLRLNAVGDTLWTLLFGGSNNDGAYAVGLTSDRGYILFCMTTSFGAGGIDVYLIKTAPDPIGIKEQQNLIQPKSCYMTTFINEPLFLPQNIAYKIFDITGRVIAPDKMKPGVYFIEVDGKITQKIIMIR